MDFQLSNLNRAPYSQEQAMVPSGQAPHTRDSISRQRGPSATHSLCLASRWQDLCSTATEAACPPDPGYRNGWAGFAGQGPGAVPHSIRFQWDPML